MPEIGTFLLDGASTSEAQRALYGVRFVRRLTTSVLHPSQSALASFTRLHPEKARGTATIEQQLDVFCSRQPCSCSLTPTPDHHSSWGLKLAPPSVGQHGHASTWTITFLSALKRHAAGQDVRTTRWRLVLCTWQTRVARALFRGRAHRNQNLLFPFAHLEHESAIHEASLLKLNTRLLHQLRHNGASADALAGTQEAEIQTRGRWQSREIVALCKKHCRYQCGLHRLKPSHRAHARSEEQWLGNQLSKLLARGSTVSWRDISSGPRCQRARSLLVSSLPVHIPRRLRTRVL